ncbi:hypothetical protein PSAC2689_100075 [Paraburkholderia sacchari]
MTYQNRYEGLGSRYQVYTREGVTMRRFSAPWRWLSQLYVTVFCGN